MSPNIWTQCAAKFRFCAFSAQPYRAVEAQHVNATRKLVDSDDEQALLEGLIEKAKPKEPPPVRAKRLHYLLSTPFRHPPLRHGSRFGRRQEMGIWYGAESRKTVFLEKAYYALLFLEGTTADLGPVTQPLTVFQVSLKTDAGADLTRAPFGKYEAQISSPTTYAHSQALGSVLRSKSVTALRYISARDPDRGINFALFLPIFTRKAPKNEQGWVCISTHRFVEFKPNIAVPSRERLRIERELLEVDGRLPAPGLTA